MPTSVSARTISSRTPSSAKVGESGRTGAPACNGSAVSSEAESNAVELSSVELGLSLLTVRAIASLQRAKARRNDSAARAHSMCRGLALSGGQWVLDPVVIWHCRNFELPRDARLCCGAALDHMIAVARPAWGVTRLIG
ncbi:hypothetical protein GCM10023321_39050 [Pseudonocardia eucalypti]|uniref:Uncharacterized protein n=1 Tax=Pseudonocardia eucalypti TaxID=648755 RepID=A0ABP9Q9X9_9PSEU